MFEFKQSTTSSIPSLKRPCTETAETDCVPKILKLEDLHVDHVNKELQLEPHLGAKNDERKENKTIGQVSLILNDQKKNVEIYPGQLLWCRLAKSPFWPSIVWPTKSGKITDDRRRVLVKFFAKKDAKVWIKMENVFPFDGLESFANMKNSLDAHHMTTSMRREFDFAFNIVSELWPRAVAEAIYCLEKGREERLSLFTVFTSSCKKKKAWALKRGSLELNTSNSCLVKSRVKCISVSDEMNRVQSFIEEISFPIAGTSTKSQKTVYVEGMLLKLVTESLDTRKFDGVDKLCIICTSNKSTEKLIECAICSGFMHRKCAESRFPQSLVDSDSAGESNYLICECCTDRSKQFCFICKTGDDDSSQAQMINCKVPNCWRRYHLNCLKDWPQTKWPDSNQDLICPSHECHQCASKATKNDNEAELTTCIKCPSALHSRASCIHAGTIILSDSHHICINHRQLRQSIWNLDYCHVCKTSCNLLSCSTCPHSYHELCSSSTSTCVTCFNRQHPVYGDIVWGKLYTYAWWPAIIVAPHYIPQNIRIDNHSPHDICVWFFGDHKFAWIDRESVHPFDENNFALFTENSNKFSEAVMSAKKWISFGKHIKSRKSTDSAPRLSSIDYVGPAPYTRIVENIPIAPATLFFDSNNEPTPCQCDVNDDDPCGVSSICLNRASCTECNDQCPSGADCGNKCIQQGKYAAVHLKYFGSKGFGLTSAVRIPCGAIVSQYTGEVITSTEFERRIEDKMRSNVYFMKYTKDLYIDGERRGSLARFINHSCNPNCLFRLWSVNGVNVVAVVALKDIPEDTEITCKYDWSRNIPCLCNEDNCTGLC